MRRTDWKFLVDTLLFICMGGIISIGLLMGFVLGEGPDGGGKSKYFLDLHRHQWGEIHLILSLAFSVLVIIHLILSWSWIKGKARRLFKGSWPAVLALIVLLTVAAVAVGWVASTKNDPAYEKYGQGEARGPHRAR